MDNLDISKLQYKEPNALLWTIVAMMGFIIVGMILFFVIWPSVPKEYRYVDLDGNTGYARQCFGSNSGLECMKNGGFISVKQFEVAK